MSQTRWNPVFESQHATENLTPMFIGGEWRGASSEGAEPVFNPATGEVLCRVPMEAANGQYVDEAAQAATRAFPAWRETPVTDRVQYLFHYKQLLQENFEALARQVTVENGKTLEDARAEVRRGIEVVDFACGMPTLMMGETVEQIARGIDGYTVRVPVGVAAGICPFNFPVMIPLWMFPIAIAAGNTFVLKPSERTPLSGVLLAELFSRTGAPAGILNLVHGGRDTVDSLLQNGDIRAISFVGSAPVAKYVYEQAAATGKRVQALGGAKNHLIVMADADLDLTVKAILSSAFGAAGQRCLAGSVVIAVGEVGDELVARLWKSAAQLRLGSGLQQDVAMGPLVRQDAVKRVRSYVEQGLQQGARLVLDGGSADSQNGFFVRPFIFDHVTPEMTIAKEEIFGPVLCVMRARELDDALAIANTSRFGNAASIFTRSGAAARQFRTRVQAGMVGVNIGVAAPAAFFPFTGWKGSFFGDLHATGKDGVRFYTETRAVVERW